MLNKNKFYTEGGGWEVGLLLNPAFASEGAIVPATQVRASVRARARS